MFPEWLVPVLVQFPLVAIFMWFVLELLKRQDAALAAREAADEVARTKREAEWREFLKNMATETNAAMSRFADEMRANTVAVTGVNAVILAHDMIKAQLTKEKSDAPR